MQILRQGAKQLIQQAVEAELHELLIEHADHCTKDGKVGVVRNGYLPERELQTGIGPVTVQIPKVRSRTGEPVTFRSALVVIGVNERGEKCFLARLSQMTLKITYFEQFFFPKVLILLSRYTQNRM